MTTETKIRTIVAAVVALNAVLMMLGITRFENMTEESIYAIVSAVAMVIMWWRSHYYNNDFSPEGVMGTQQTRELKRQFRESEV